MMNKVFYDLVRSAPSGRWNSILRNYGPEEVSRLRSGVQIEYTLAVSADEQIPLGGLVFAYLLSYTSRLLDKSIVTFSTHTHTHHRLYDA